MAKKTNRPTSKSRGARPARRVQRPAAGGASQMDRAVVDEDLTPRAAPASSPSPALVASPAGVAAARRLNARKAPVTIVNYDYLKRDIRQLAVLATAMIVLLIIAYFIWH